MWFGAKWGRLFSIFAIKIVSHPVAPTSGSNSGSILVQGRNASTVTMHPGPHCIRRLYCIHGHNASRATARPRSRCIQGHIAHRVTVHPGSHCIQDHAASRDRPQKLPMQPSRAGTKKNYIHGRNLVIFCCTFLYFFAFSGWQRFHKAAAMLWHDFQAHA